MYGFSDAEKEGAITVAVASRRAYATFATMPPLSDDLADLDTAYKKETAVVEDTSAATNPSPEVEADVRAPVMQAKVVLDGKITKLEEEEQEKVAKFRARAMRHVDTHVKIVVEPASDAEVSELLANTAVMSHLGDPSDRTHVMIVYDVAQGGECDVQAKTRLPPLRTLHLKKMLGGIIRRRWQTHGQKVEGDDVDTIVLEGKPTPQVPQLLPNDAYVLFDGQKTGTPMQLNFTVYSLIICACCVHCFPWCLRS